MIAGLFTSGSGIGCSMPVMQMLCVKSPRAAIQLLQKTPMRCLDTFFLERVSESSLQPSVAMVSTVATPQHCKVCYLSETFMPTRTRCRDPDILVQCGTIG